ncbi:MAG TPA: FAD:protein FMN transferase [Candidatus Saccharimonadales bacterium]|nr:FAD:protein FMN transferase [Candidatus Saccharimonadales bacterium]
MPDVAPEPCFGPESRKVRAEPLMGTVIALDVRDPGLPEEVIDSVFAWFRQVDATFSTFRSDSEISRLSRRELGLSECSRDVREVIFLCDEVCRRSDGCFDIWTGGRCDPSALVKGWSVERASQMLAAAGARNFFINAGGDIIARGRPARDRAWRVGIRHPEQTDRLAAVLAVSDLAVATSGTYERGEHIVDPRTRNPPTGLLSMTVIGPSLAYADAYSTAAFVMGDRGASWVAGIDGYAALAITEQHRTVWTEGADHLIVRDCPTGVG